MRTAPAATTDSAARRRCLGKPLAGVAACVVAAAGAAAVFSSAFAAPAASGQTVASPAAAAAPAPVRVAVVGDSLIATTTPEQEAALVARGYEATVAGNPGKPLTDPWIQDRLGETGDADIVVVATASNDNVALARRADTVGVEQAGAEYAATLAATLDRVSAPCMVVVDVRDESSAMYRPDLAATTNELLRSVAAERSAVVVPWSTVSDGHDQGDWFVEDELHFVNGADRRDAGIAAYADAIADGVDACRTQLAR